MFSLFENFYLGLIWCKILLIARLNCEVIYYPLFYISETTYINNISFIYLYSRDPLYIYPKY